MDIAKITELIELMVRNNLNEIEIEEENSKIRLRKDFAPHPPPLPNPPPHYLGSSQHIVEIKDKETSLLSPSQTAEIRSPMVGIFYRAPSPNAQPYVEVGQEVHEDTVVCIIEAMKVMNEIKAELHGIITEVLAENGKPVDFNRPLFRVKLI
ncbi:acetyl-CoA carboxylase biotin carboxyl carrier protein [Methylacidiphilum caldifontis]|uniref:Biotin carboxyl carrier protein of acetyl-CoA carboxylase n=1 Tax=Methylacidiphilum caldifontis TaxID=2795386 RepID=A0A4Y8PD91_9BACT|nr:acetyl-CoA carboxylase biotin carboxyl carrier protein [Methylacidiphilum caldifontis]QSR88522.1 acetyl-CoA carboxylase biotin carboxyl carrier protein [Methylacidiphilum caldifontis]TFE69049.1 acetyl-CoA carboxylase, biotin carboxyl carrier protein [Methylacidiphilum caldifontis]